MKDLKMMMLPVIIMMAYMRAISRDTKMAIMMATMATHRMKNSMVIHRMTASMVICRMMILIIFMDDGLLCHHEPRSHLDRLRSQHEGRRDAASVSDASGGDHRNADRIRHLRNQGHGGGLAGGAADDDGVGAVFQLEVDEPAQGGQVHRLVVEGCDNGHAGAGENGCSHICTSYTVQ